MNDNSMVAPVVMGSEREFEENKMVMGSEREFEDELYVLTIFANSKTRSRQVAMGLCLINKSNSPAMYLP